MYFPWNNRAMSCQDVAKERQKLSAQEPVCFSALGRQKNTGILKCWKKHSLVKFDGYLEINNFGTHPIPRKNPFNPYYCHHLFVDSERFCSVQAQGAVADIILKPINFSRLGMVIKICLVVISARALIFSSSSSQQRIFFLSRGVNSIR